MSPAPTPPTRLGAAPAESAQLGIGPASRRLAAAFVAAGRTRIELALLELEEQRRHLARLWILATLTIALFIMAAALAVGGCLLAVDATDRAWVAAGLSGAFALTGAVTGLVWKRVSHRSRPWLAASLAELAQDEAELQPASPVADSGAIAPGTATSSHPP